MQGQSAMDTICNSGQEEAVITYVVCSLVILILLHHCTCTHAIHEKPFNLTKCQLKHEDLYHLALISMGYQTLL